MASCINPFVYARQKIMNLILLIYVRKRRNQLKTQQEIEEYNQSWPEAIKKNS